METITREQFDSLQIGNQLKSEYYSLTVEAKFLNTIIALDNNDGIAGVYSFDGLVRSEYSIISNSELLEKAIREYPIGTKIKSIYNGYIYICNTKPVIYSSLGHIYVKDENESPKCLYDKTKNKWAEIINQNIMTQQEFKDLKVGDFISNYEIIHKYKEFLIVKCDDGHDLFDLAKINKYGLKLVKSELIDWDKPQLVYFNDIVVLTTGDHFEDHFTGVSITGEYELSSKWKKALFKNSLILKTYEDKVLFVNAILNPPEPSETLKKAQLNYLKFIEDNESKDSGVKSKTRKKEL